MNKMSSFTVIYRHIVNKRSSNYIKKSSVLMGNFNTAPSIGNVW